MEERKEYIRGKDAPGVERHKIQQNKEKSQQNEFKRGSSDKKIRLVAQWKRHYNFFLFFTIAHKRKRKILHSTREEKAQKTRIPYLSNTKKIKMGVFPQIKKRKNVRVRSFKKKIDKNTQLFQLLEQTKEVKKKANQKRKRKRTSQRKKIKSKIFTSRASLPPSYIILANACWTCRSISRDFWMYSPSTRRAACRSDHF